MILLILCTVANGFAIASNFLWRRAQEKRLAAIEAGRLTMAARQYIHHSHHSQPRTDRGPQRKLRVQCTIEVEVEYDLDSPARFMIEENSCPGTGAVGAAIDQAMEDGERRGVCWACNLKGENKILSSEPPLEADPE